MKKNLRFILPGLYLLVVIYLVFVALYPQTGDDLFSWLPLLFASFPVGFLLSIIFLDAGDVGVMIVVGCGVLCNVALLYLLGKWISGKIVNLGLS